MEANEVRYLLMRNERAALFPRKSERGEPSHDLFRRQKRYKSLFTAHLEAEVKEKARALRHFLQRDRRAFG